MKLARFSLGLTAIAFALFGVLFISAPRTLENVGAMLLSPSARVEIRGFYGGMELGLGVFFALCAMRPSWYPVGLTAQALSLGGVVVGRLVGAIVDGPPSATILFFWVLETLATVLAVVALKRLDRTERV